MKERTKYKLNTEAIVLSQDLMYKAMIISATTETDVFIEYSPHTQWVSLRVFYEGWISGVKPEIRIDASCAEELYEQDKLLDICNIVDKMYERTCNEIKYNSVDFIMMGKESE